MPHEEGMEADKNGLIWLDKPQLFHQVMANELSMKQSLLISAVQQLIAAAAFNEKVNAAARKRNLGISSQKTITR